MKIVCNGYNPWINEPILETEILKLDGTKLAELDICIHGIEYQQDVESLINELQVIKFCFGKKI